MPFSFLVGAGGLAIGCGSDAKPTLAMSAETGGSLGAAGAGAGSATGGAAGASNSSGTAGIGGESAASFCGSVLLQGVPDVALTAARLVPAAAGNPTFCLVSGVLEGRLNYQVALPENWNHKLLFIGGGGFDGTVPDIAFFSSPGSLAAGYAIVANDSGHQGMGTSPDLDGSWALDDERALTAYASTSTHQVLAPATAIIQARYGSPIEKFYFEGCSNGGREALIAAQRWPKDFDGIIARAPAYNFTGSMTAFQRNAQLMQTLRGSLTPAKLATLAEAELSACDADDGVSDGIITRPDICGFDATTLRCRGDSDETCLTDLELTTLMAIRAPTPLPYAQRDSLAESAPWPIGHEGDEGWWVWILGDPAPFLQFAFQDQFIKYFVTKNPNEDTLATSLADYAARMSELSSLLDATSADLSEFQQRGGKLILWHGVADLALSAAGTAEYYERAVLRAGGRAAADEFLRFFTAAGVYHCGGGPGADSADLLSALDAWVVDGAPPDDVVATRAVSNANPVPITRPLCAYPSSPRYLGSGDANVAASYSCAAP